MCHLLLLALLFFCGLACAETNPAPSMPSKDIAKLQSSFNQPTGHSKPNVVEISKTPVIHVETIDKTEKIHDYFSSEMWLVYITGALAIFTGMLYKATVALGKEAKATSERQALEMVKSLAAAQKSADAATRTVETMESTAERQLRAYIFATSDERMSSDPTGATIGIRNYGQTPAYEVLCSVNIGLYNFPLDECLCKPSFVGASKTPLAPSSNTVKLLPILTPLLNQSEKDAILAERSAIYVWGEIAYVDIFKKNRLSRFRLYSTGDNFTRGTLTYHHEGNDSD